MLTDKAKIYTPANKPQICMPTDKPTMNLRTDKTYNLYASVNLQSICLQITLQRSLQAFGNVGGYLIMCDFELYCNLHILHDYVLMSQQF